MTYMVMSCYAGFMKTVNISGLKAHLSMHLELVRKGEEVLVCDRHTPVARIIPCAAEDYAAQEQRLVSRGVLLPPQRKHSRAKVGSWPVPPGNISRKTMEQVWRQERDDR